MTVQKGTLVEFAGELDVDSPATTYYLRVNNFIRSKEKFDSRWKLIWNTANESLAYCTLYVCRIRLNGEEERLAKIQVDLVEGSPVRIL